MKNIFTSVIHLVSTGFLIWFVINDQWLQPILIALMQIAMILDQIHDTLKATEKGQP
jgi:hypothetical protein